MDCSLPGSSVHGIVQARILELVAISFSRGYSQPRDQTQVSCIVGRHFYHLSHQGDTNYLVLVVKNPSANAEDVRDVGSIPRSPGGGHSNPLIEVT